MMHNKIKFVLINNAELKRKINIYSYLQYYPLLHLTYYLHFNTLHFWLDATLHSIVQVLVTVFYDDKVESNLTYIKEKSFTIKAQLVRIKKIHFILI